MKIQAFSYLRVSGRSQIDLGGFPRQRDVIDHYCAANNIEIQREFVEKGVSGTKDLANREALTELFIALKSNGVRLVLVETASRLARDLMVSEILLGEFRKLGVKVISAEDGTELTVEDGDATRTLIRQILGAVAQWDKSVLVQKLAVARMRIRKTTGKCDGRKLYGQTESERAVIAQVLDLSNQGMKTAQIARTLNETGVKPRTATRAGKATTWHPMMVARIIERSKK